MTWQRPGGCDAAHCVEVTATDDGYVLMRDSKLANSPTLTWPRGVWAVLLDRVRAGCLLPSGDVCLDPDGALVTRPAADGTTASLRFDAGEWQAFVDAVRAGRFTPAALDGYRAGHRAAVARVRALADSWYGRADADVRSTDELAELCDELDRSPARPASAEPDTSTTMETNRD